MLILLKYWTCGCLHIIYITLLSHVPPINCNKIKWDTVCICKSGFSIKIEIEDGS